MTVRVVRARLMVRGLSPRALGLYRDMRRGGASRRDANLVVAGYVIGSGDGTVETVRLP